MFEMVGLTKKLLCAHVLLHFWYKLTQSEQDVARKLFRGLEKIDKARHKIAEKRQKKRKAQKKKASRQQKKKRKKTLTNQLSGLRYAICILCCCC